MTGRLAPRRLRALVLDSTSCLAGVPPRERRVLRLRAGVGRHAPLPRRRVADRLGTSVRRVTRLERRGVRRLLALRAGGTCGSGATVVPASAGAPSPAASGAALAVLVPGPARATPPGTFGGSATGPGSDVRAPRPGPDGGAAPELHGEGPVVPLRPSAGGDGGPDVTVPVVLLALVAAGFAIARDLRRRNVPRI